VVGLVFDMKRVCTRDGSFSVNITPLNYDCKVIPTSESKKVSSFQAIQWLERVGSELMVIKIKRHRIFDFFVANSSLQFFAICNKVMF
jgi:hypothetical protein